MLLGFLFLASVGCSKTIDTSLERRERNEKAFAEYASKEGYSKQSLPGMIGKDAFVYMQWIARGSETGEYPKASDLVQMHYRGTFLTSGGQFDSNFDREANTLEPMRVYSLVPGMAIALQNMRVGDHVRVVIPWYLGYGAVDRQIIPSYSALLFEVKLNKIIGDAVSN